MSSTTLTAESFRLVQDSYRRCMLQNDFLPQFHKKLIGSSQEVAKYFDQLPQNHQYRILAKSVAELVTFAEHQPTAIRKMDEIARKHGRTKLNIPAELYTFYSLSAMETFQGLDPEWNSEIESAWEQTLSQGIEYLIRNTQSRF